MSSYGKFFAGLYNTEWSMFSRRVAMGIMAFHQAMQGKEKRQRILDVGCGTGHLLQHFLDNGYTGTGIDLSADMLAYARENCARFVAEGKVDFREADASSFELEQRYDLVVSTYDTLAHLGSFQQLESSLACVRKVLEPDGFFFFDLNTEKGLSRWNNISVEDGPDGGIKVTRGIFSPGMPRSMVRVTYFASSGAGSYLRHDETISNLALKMRDVKEAVIKAGFKTVHCTNGQNPTVDVPDPEALERAFFIVRG